MKEYLKSKEIKAHNFDVIVVGCGPVGAIIANLLGMEGLNVCIIEKEKNIYDKPRAIVLDWEAMRALQYCNVAYDLEPTIIPHTGTDYLGVDNSLIKLFDPQPPPYSLGWPSTIMFVQPILEKLLRKSLLSKGNIKFLNNTTLENVNQKNKVVKAEIIDQRKNKKSSIYGKFLIGCDGANSIIRSLIKTEMKDHKFDESWIVVDAHLLKNTNLPNKTTQYCWPSRPATYVVGPGKLRRWEIKILPSENRSKFYKEEEVLKVLKNYVDIDALDIWRSATYRHKVVVAKKWRKNQIFLAGDAAHQTPPFLGQGLCTGIRDAYNLSWKLIHNLKYEFNEKILDTYEKERKPHATKVIKHAKEFGLIIGEMDVNKAKRRDKKLKAQLQSGKMQTTRQKFIPDLKGGMLINGKENQQSLVGTLFVQPRVRNELGKESLLDDFLPMRFLYVTFKQKTQVWFNDYDHFWKKIGGLRVNIQSQKIENRQYKNILNFQEIDDFFSTWCAKNNISSVIVRPDRYVYGIANNKSDLKNIFKDFNFFLTRK